MRRKFLGIFAAAALLITLLPSFSVKADEKPSVSALAAVLISADTGEIVYSENSETKLPMASTTKIMSALICLESGSLYDEFTVDSDAIKVEGSSMGLQEGDVVTKYALCCGMLLPSGNDAANAAAVEIAGSIDAFADMMNERAQEIGMSQTYFVTPSGLEGEGHGSSAEDMALLAREALRNPLFAEICSSQNIKVSFGNPPYERWLTNTNKLLSMYDGVYGVKTGFTDEAGRCLVSACERDGKRLICVTLNDKNDWNDHIALYEYGFTKVTCEKISLPEFIEVDIVGSQAENIKLISDSSAADVTMLSKDKSAFSYKIISPPFVYAPVAEGEQLASLVLTYKDKEICEIPLFAESSYDAVNSSDNASSKKENLLDKTINFFRRIFS